MSLCFTGLQRGDNELIDEQRFKAATAEVGGRMGGLSLFVKTLIESLCKVMCQGELINKTGGGLSVCCCR